MKKKNHPTNKEREKVAVALSSQEISILNRLVRRGTAKARAITRARILLLSHRGKTNGEIMDVLGCAQWTVTDVRKRYRDRGSLDAVIEDAPRSGQPKKITPAHEAFVAATACTEAPEGHDHWTLEALKEKLLETYDDLDSVSHERIRRILITAALKPWREKNVVRAQTHG
jgi:putative transposase